MSLVSFALLFGGALLGLLLASRLPKQHLTPANREVVTLGMGLVGTIAGIALGLQVSSAYSYYNNQTAELVRASADVASLGNLLRQYGPEAQAARESLRNIVEEAASFDRLSGEIKELKSKTDPNRPLDDLYAQLRDLPVESDKQKLLKPEVLSLVRSLSQMRWLIVEQTASTVLKPLLFVLIFWLTAIFFSWGLFAPRSVVAITTFLVAAVCVSGAILLILELYMPYGGLLHMSDAPLRIALKSLGS